MSNDHNFDKDLDVVKQNWLVLQYTSPQSRTNRKIVLAAVEPDGRALELASPELKAEREIVLTAIEQKVKEFRL